MTTCDDLDSVRMAIESSHPDVVLSDIRMPPTRTDEGLRLAGMLRQSHPQLGVVILSHFADPAYVLELLESGSDRRGYLLKERVHSRGELVINAIFTKLNLADAEDVSKRVTAALLFLAEGT